MALKLISFFLLKGAEIVLLCINASRFETDGPSVRADYVKDIKMNELMANLDSVFIWGLSFPEEFWFGNRSFVSQSSFGKCSNNVYSVASQFSCDKHCSCLRPL